MAGHRTGDVSSELVNANLGQGVLEGIALIAMFVGRKVEKTHTGQNLQPQAGTSWVSVLVFSPARLFTSI